LALFEVGADLSISLSNASASFSALAGYDVRETGLSEAISRVSMEDCAPILKSLHAAPKAPVTARFRYQHPTRGERWHELFGRAHRSLDGDVQIAVYLHDVTDAQHARDVAESEARDAQKEGLRLARLADTVPGVLFQSVFAPNGELSHRYASHGAEDLFGLSPSRMVSEPRAYLARLAADDRARYLDELAMAAVDLKPFSTTVRYDHPLRGEIALRVIARPEPILGGATLMHEFASDVTDMVQKERELRTAIDAAEALSRRLGLAAGAANIGFWEFDPQTGVLRWDDVMFDLFGVNPADFGGVIKDWADAVHPEDLAPAREALGRSIELRQQLGVQFRIIRRDGAIRHIVGNATAFEEGGRACVLGVNTDVTDFVEAQQRADAAVLAKAAFLANMSHEIRTPMNGVVALAGALAATPLDPRQREMVELVRSSGETLERLLSDILDSSRIEAGKLALENAPFDLRAAVETAAQVMRVRADDKGLAFDVRYGAGAQGAFLGDAVRIRQIISNLTANAVKFTASGGVRVDVDVEDIAGLSWLSIEVSDTGIGFNADARDRLFARFEQADASITRTYGGSGLGLAICKSLCEAMGGSIDVQSEPDVGTRFTVRLPAPRVDPATQADGIVESLADEEPGARLEGLRVLLAEDHPVNQRVVSLLLEPLGVDVTVAANGAEALDLFKTGPFDLILMDMQMPVMDGVSATRAIRDLESARACAATPIIMLSANALKEHQEQARAAGCDLHVAKPVTAERLIAALIEATTLAARRKSAAA
jgi:PAS domain S-box-containing protein